MEQLEFDFYNEFDAQQLEYMLAIRLWKSVGADETDYIERITDSSYARTGSVIVFPRSR